MKFNKKSEGLSLSVVVIAAIVLLVLIVLIMIFSGRLGSWGKSVDTCPPNSVDPQGSDECTGTTIPSRIISINGETKYCCPGTGDTAKKEG
jgi:hypothetical protein